VAELPQPQTGGDDCVSLAVAEEDPSSPAGSVAAAAPRNAPLRITVASTRQFGAPAGSDASPSPAVADSRVPGHAGVPSVVVRARTNTDASNSLGTPSANGGGLAAGSSPQTASAVPRFAGGTPSAGGPTSPIAGAGHGLSHQQHSSPQQAAPAGIHGRPSLYGSPAGGLAMSRQRRNSTGAVPLLARQATDSSVGALAPGGVGSPLSPLSAVSRPLLHPGSLGKSGRLVLATAGSSGGGTPLATGATTVTVGGATIVTSGAPAGLPPFSPGSAAGAASRSLTLSSAGGALTGLPVSTVVVSADGSAAAAAGAQGSSTRTNSVSSASSGFALGSGVAGAPVIRLRRASLPAAFTLTSPQLAAAQAPAQSAVSSTAVRAWGAPDASVSTAIASTDAAVAAGSRPATAAAAADAISGLSAPPKVRRYSGASDGARPALIAPSRASAGSAGEVFASAGSRSPAADAFGAPCVAGGFTASAGGAMPLSPTYSQTASSTAASTRHLLGGQHAALPLTARSAAAAKANATGTAATQPSVAACTSVSVATEADAGDSPIVISSVFSPTSAGATAAASSGAAAQRSFAEAPVRASVSELEQTDADADAAPPVEVAEARKTTFKGAAMAVVAATSLRLAGRRRSVNVSDMRHAEAEDPDAQPANQLWSLLAVLSAVQVFTGACKRGRCVSGLLFMAACCRVGCCSASGARAFVKQLFGAACC